MALDMRGLKAVPAKTDEEFNMHIQVSGTDDAAVNGFVAKADSLSGTTTTATGEIVGVRGKAYLESSGTYTNDNGLITGVLGALKIIGTNTYSNSGACVTGQVHGDSTGTVGAIFKGINSGTGTVLAFLDMCSVAPTYVIKFISASIRYGITPAQLVTIAGANIDANIA